MLEVVAPRQDGRWYERKPSDGLKVLDSLLFASRCRLWDGMQASCPCLCPTEGVETCGSIGVETVELE